MKFDHYSMCVDCAKAKGGELPDNACGTVTIGDCKYCKKPKLILWPWVDFDWPNDKKLNLKAKMNRD